ncbi:MAG: peptide deformylase [Bacteroidia bacterium]|nr:peptide deformylase [Bacteroidales bacterium]MDD3962385.1 peptide deformylase [Bacteroidales bacterium]NCD42450.1 peptide deformylase [Bacteroidia bacterium]
MVLPVTAYGHPVLRKRAKEIDKTYEGLAQLIDDMFETMYVTVGVGLAAPQINRSIRLVVIDASPYGKDDPSLEDFKKVLLNPVMVSETGEDWLFNEGCLSIPDIHEEVSRKPEIHIQYYDRDWNFHDDTFRGIAARIIQHEYDHLEGILFVDRLSSLRKMMLKKRLNAISNGDIDVDYRMIFPPKKKKKR